MFVTTSNCAPTIFYRSQINVAVNAIEIRSHFAEYPQPSNAAVGINVQAHMCPDTLIADRNKMMRVTVQVGFGQYFYPAIFRMIQITTLYFLAPNEDVMKYY